jgi:hypothetical protein
MVTVYMTEITVQRIGCEALLWTRSVESCESCVPIRRGTEKRLLVASMTSTTIRDTHVVIATDTPISHRGTMQNRSWIIAC